MKTKIRLLLFLILLYPPWLLANTDYFNQALNLYKKEFVKAKFKFEQDLVVNPKNEKSYLFLSKIFNYQKKKDLEEQNLNTVILLNPKNEEAVFNLAKLKLEKSDFQESKILIEKLKTFCKKYCKKSEKLKTEIENSIKN